MKQSPYCGKEYPDDATTCAIDETLLEEPRTRKERNADWLQNLWTLYMLLCSVVAGVLVFMYLTNWQRMSAALPFLPLTVLRFIVFLRPLAIVAIWWKSRWGVVAFIALCIIASLTNFAIGINSALEDIVGCVFFIILVRTQWERMTWDLQVPKVK